MRMFLVKFQILKKTRELDTNHIKHIIMKQRV